MIKTQLRFLCITTMLLMPGASFGIWRYITSAGNTALRIAKTHPKKTTVGVGGLLYYYSDKMADGALCIGYHYPFYMPQPMMARCMRWSSQQPETLVDRYATPAPSSTYKHNLLFSVGENLALRSNTPGPAELERIIARIQDPEGIIACARGIIHHAFKPEWPHTLRRPRGDLLDDLLGMARSNHIITDDHISQCKASYHDAFTSTFKDPHLWRTLMSYRCYQDEIARELTQKDRAIAQCIIDDICRTRSIEDISPTLISKTTRILPNAADQLAHHISASNFERMDINALKAICCNPQSKSKLFERLSPQIDAIIRDQQLYTNKRNIGNIVKTYPRYAAIFPEAFTNYCHTDIDDQYNLRVRSQLSKGDTYDKILYGDFMQDDVAHAVAECESAAKDEKLKHRYTFVHGQRWKWHGKAALFKRLWWIKYNEFPHEFQFFRFWNKPSSDACAQEQKERQHIISQRAHKPNPLRTLFTNAPVYGNLHSIGSCSLLIFANSAFSSSGEGISCTALFEELGLPHDLYKKYEDEITQLMQEHNSLTQHGNLVLLSLTHDQAERFVLPGIGLSLNTPVTLQNSRYDTRNIWWQLHDYWYHHGKTVHAPSIINALSKQPDATTVDDICAWEDLEFRMWINREQGGLCDPQNGPRMYSFNTADKKHLAQWQRKLDDLARRMEQDYRNGNFS